LPFFVAVIPSGARDLSFFLQATPSSFCGVGLGFLFSMDFVAQAFLFVLSLEGPVLLCFSSPGLLIADRWSLITLSPEAPPLSLSLREYVARPAPLDEGHVC
jgi:hypothetical protein